ncbi:TonB-dependent receptor [Marinimicrobium alkaliphilum]|uniref:TonB-dependent receptor n=1 Tax=Marinimicrobium alkaliphilum TaxID=2202654 RepID=UPI001300A8A3|nr:TonB-dependent receptor [Marinimicrobium alkaliphilum]
MFRKNKLSQAMLSVAMASSMAGMAGTALAQDEAILEEVVVTGIRASLERAQDIKRNSSGVVDAIAAEDIGRFPDANLAESLQRVPGVSIDRSAGEGNSVSVRGMGPTYNLVMVNGRQMPSSSDGRDFNFNDLAAELVNGVEVRKTANATDPSGGIGASINVTTARPLDIGQFRAAGTLKGVTDTDQGDITPEVSALFSNTFADDTIGVLFAVSYQQRKYEQERVAVDGWRPNTNYADGAITNPEVNQTPNLFFAQNYNISVRDTERERTNAALTFQYAPNADLTVTADYLYSKLENDWEYSQFGVWFNSGALSDVVINENGTVIDMFEEGTFDNIQDWGANASENNSFGVNVDWQLTDRFNLSLDANMARSEQNPGGEFNQYQAIIGYRNQQRFQIIDGAELPVLTNIYDANPDRVQAPFCGNGNWTDTTEANCQSYAAANNIDPDSAETGTGPDGEIWQAGLRAHRNDIQSGNTVDDLNQFRIAGTWEDDNLTLRSGLMFTDQKKNNRLKYNAHGGADMNVVEQFGGFYGYPNLNDNVDLSGRTRTGSGFLSQFSGNENLPDRWVYYNPQDVFDVIWATAGDGYTQIPTEWSPNSYQVREETLATYVEADFDTYFFDMPLNVLTGMRFERTDISSTGQENNLIGLEFTDPTQMQPIYEEGGLTEFTDSQNYSVLLPSLTLRLDITDDVVGRFAASRTITRPGIGSLRSTRTIGDTRPGGGLTASAGNPGLKPFSSDNIDLGVEWYYSPLSYVSAGVFVKFIDDFIVGGTRRDSINDVTDPSSAGGTIDNPTPPAQASLAMFNISSDVNGPTARVEGIELAIQHEFGYTGFGVGANVTFVDTDRKLDPQDVDQRFAITGLSNSANLVGYYEQGPWSARLAYNWRDQFLQCFCQLQGGDAVFVDDYGQWDASVSYDVTQNISVLLEGINLTGEGYRSTGRYDEQLYEAISTGPRFALGVRASF